MEKMRWEKKKIHFSDFNFYASPQETLFFAKFSFKSYILFFVFRFFFLTKVPFITTKLCLECVFNYMLSYKQPLNNYTDLSESFWPIHKNQNQFIRVVCSQIGLHSTMCTMLESCVVSLLSLYCIKTNMKKRRN